MSIVTEATFRDGLESSLAPFWSRVLTLFHEYGPALSGDLYNVLRLAVDQGKVVEVLDVLERHLNEHLQFQHPALRGLGVTEVVMFSGLYQNTIKRQPV